MSLGAAHHKGMAPNLEHLTGWLHPSMEGCALPPYRCLSEWLAELVSSVRVVIAP